MPSEHGTGEVLSRNGEPFFAILRLQHLPQRLQRLGDDLAVVQLAGQPERSTASGSPSPRSP